MLVQSRVPRREASSLDLTRAVNVSGVWPQLFRYALTLRLLLGDGHRPSFLATHRFKSDLVRSHIIRERPTSSPRSAPFHVPAASPCARRRRIVSLRVLGQEARGLERAADSGALNTVVHPILHCLISRRSVASLSQRPASTLLAAFVGVARAVTLKGASVSVEGLAGVLTVRQPRGARGLGRGPLRHRARAPRERCETLRRKPHSMRDT